MRVFVISKDIARSGMMEFLDAFERSREFRDDFDIILAKEGEAADILQVVYTDSEIFFFKIDVTVGNSDQSMGIYSGCEGQ